MKTSIESFAPAKRIVKSLVVAVVAAVTLSNAKSAQVPPPDPARPPSKIPRSAGFRDLPLPPPTALVQQPAISGGAFACMADAGNPPGTAPRDLDGAKINDYRSMTNQSCRSTCAQQKFVYAGTQNGGTCFCGNTVGSYGPAASTSPARSCNLGCAGNPNEVCGGEWTNSVSLTGVTPSAPTDGGQCLVKAQGGYMSSGGAAGQYNAVELHRWEKLATTASTATTKTYSFRYTMTASGYMDQTGAGGQWRGNWGGTFSRTETWQGVLTNNPATGQPAWRLSTPQGFATPVPYTGVLLNPLRPDPNTSVMVRTFAYPQYVWSTVSQYVFPTTTGTTSAWLYNNPLGSATYTCSWNVSL